MMFLADMGISPRSMERLPDTAILEKARSEGPGLLTHDLDFGELMAASGASLPSVVIFRLRNMKPDRVDRYLDEIIGQHQEVLEKGAIVSAAEGQIRVPVLPIEDE